MAVEPQDEPGKARATPGLEGDDFSRAATVTENTPLLGSDADSFRTLGEDDGAAPAGAADGRSGAADGQEGSIGLGQALAIILSMWMLIFLQASNMSGIATTQSTIAEELDAYENAMWFTSSYLIATASLAPLVGRLSTIFSPGSLVLVSSFFFAVGAIVTSQARSFAVFIAGRVLIGTGGAGIMTLSLILVLQLTSKRRRGLFIGLVNAGFTIGLSTGAVVFGALLPAIGWRALFWLQSPIGVLAGLGVYFSLPSFAKKGGLEDRTVLQKLARVDYAGAITLTLSIVLFLYGLSGTIQPLPIILSLAVFALFYVIERFLAADPIIPLAVLQSRGVLLSCLAQLGFMAARWSVLFYAPIFVLAVRGLSPAMAGAVLIPTNAGFGSGGLLVGWLHVRRAGSFWLPSVVSIFLFGLALAGLAGLSNAASPAWLYMAVVFANGFCTGAALNYTLAHLLHLSSPDTHFIATGLLATFRGFAGSFGTAIGGGIFGRTLGGALEDGFRQLDGGGDGELSDARQRLIKRLVGSPALVFGGGLSADEQAVAVQGYEAALRVLYQSAVVLTLFVVFVQAGSGWEGPEVEEDEDEVREAIAEHDGNMEA